MLQKKFFIKDALSQGWEKTRKNLKVLLPMYLLFGIIYILPELLAEVTGPGVHVTLNLLLLPVYALMFLGLIKVSLDLLSGGEARVSDLFSQKRLILRYLIASIIFAAATTAGFFLFILPGVYLAIRFGFFGHFIIDEECGTIESLKNSWKITGGSELNLLLLGLLASVLNFLGALAFLIGLLITSPLTMNALAFAYYKLKGGPDEFPGEEEVEEGVGVYDDFELPG